MRQFLLIAAAMLASSVCFAQTLKTDTVKSLKPSAHSITTELNVNPFNGQINLNNTLNQIKLRYFATRTLAVRLGFNITKTDSSSNVNNPYGTSGYFSNNNRHMSTVSLNLGVEKHFNGTRRLSPYVGADLSFSNKSSHQTITDNQSTTEVTNAWSYSYYNGSTVLTGSSQNAYTKYGINLFTGFDFYIAQHFFFGYELNYGVSKINWKNASVTTTTLTNGAPLNNNLGKNSSLNYGATLSNGIRLGYSF